MVFRKGGKLKKKFCWMYDNKSIDVVDNFNYLGITLNFDAIFTKHKMYLPHRVKRVYVL